MWTMESPEVRSSLKNSFRIRRSKRPRCREPPSRNDRDFVYIIRLYTRKRRNPRDATSRAQRNVSNTRRVSLKIRRKRPLYTTKRHRVSLRYRVNGREAGKFALRPRDMAGVVYA